MALPGPIFGAPRRVKLGPEASRERPEPLQKKRSFLNVFRDPPKNEKQLKTHTTQTRSIGPQTEVKRKNYLSV